MRWDLWDVEAGFYFDRFPSKDEALALVRTLIDGNGDAYADVLELGTPDDLSGASNLTGAALVAAARGVDERDEERRPAAAMSSASGPADGMAAKARR